MFAFLLFDARVEDRPWPRAISVSNLSISTRQAPVSSSDRRSKHCSSIPPSGQPGGGCEALKDYITYQFVLGDQTLFSAGIRKIPPAHYLVIKYCSMGTQRSVRYWEPAGRRIPHRALVHRTAAPPPGRLDPVADAERCAGGLLERWGCGLKLLLRCWPAATPPDSSRALPSLPGRDGIR